MASSWKVLPHFAQFIGLFSAMTDQSSFDENAPAVLQAGHQVESVRVAQLHIIRTDQCAFFNEIAYPCDLFGDELLQVFHAIKMPLAFPRPQQGIQVWHESDHGSIPFSFILW